MKLLGLGGQGGSDRITPLTQDQMMQALLYLIRVTTLHTLFKIIIIFCMLACLGCGMMSLFCEGDIPVRIELK